MVDARPEATHIDGACDARSVVGDDNVWSYLACRFCREYLVALGRATVDDRCLNCLVAQVCAVLDGGDGNGGEADGGVGYLFR